MFMKFLENLNSDSTQRPSFINVKLMQILISNGVIMSRYFMQRLLKHFGRYDADLINLKVQHHFPQFNLEHLQQRLRTSWGVIFPLKLSQCCLLRGLKTLETKHLFKETTWNSF